MSHNYGNGDVAIERGIDHIRLGQSPSMSSDIYQTSDSDVEITEEGFPGRPFYGNRRPSLQVQQFSSELLSSARKSEIHPEGKGSILPLSELGFRVEGTRPRLSPSISTTSEGSHTSHRSDHSQSVMSMNTPAHKAERMKDSIDDLNPSGFQVHRQPSPLPGLVDFESFRTPEPSDDESLDASFLLGDREPSFSDQIAMAEAQIRALALKARPVLAKGAAAESTMQSDLRDRAFEKHKRQADRKFNTRLFKTELCRSWTEFGFCPYGPRCQFAHGKHEMRNRYRHKRHKTIKCKNFQAGYCPYGSRCCFIHEESTEDLLRIQQQAVDTVNEIRAKPHLFFRHASIRHRCCSPQLRRGYHSMPIPSVQASE